MSITCEIHVVHYFIMIGMIGHTLLHLCNLSNGLFSVCIHLFSSYFSEWVMIYCCIFIIWCSTIFVKIFYHNIFEMIDYIIPPMKWYHQVLVWAMMVVFCIFFHLYWIIVKVSPLSHDISLHVIFKKRSYRIFCDIAMKGTSGLGANFFTKLW